MVWFDVYMRNDLTGVQAESIGTFSFTREPFSNGMRYPDSIISGLDKYEQFAIGGISFFVS